MAQDCSLARESGPGSFQIDIDGNGSLDNVVTFIADPVEPGVIWMRHRQFVLRAGPSTDRKRIVLPALRAG